MYEQNELCYNDDIINSIPIILHLSFLFYVTYTSCKYIGINICTAIKLYNIHYNNILISDMFNNNTNCILMDKPITYLNEELENLKEELEDLKNELEEEDSKKKINENLIENLKQELNEELSDDFKTELNEELSDDFKTELNKDLLEELEDNNLNIINVGYEITDKLHNVRRSNRIANKYNWDLIE